MALDNAAASFGDNDSRTKNWQIQLNNAKATLNNLESELASNNDALAAFADNTDDAGDDAKAAAAGAGRLEDAVDDLGNDLEDTSNKTRIFGDVLKANLASEVIIGGIKAIGSAIAGISKGFVGVLKDGVAYNAQMEEYITSFTTMLGDQAKAQELVNNLKKEAAAPPSAWSTWPKTPRPSWLLVSVPKKPSCACANSGISPKVMLASSNP